MESSENLRPSAPEQDVSPKEKFRNAVNHWITASKIEEAKAKEIRDMLSHIDISTFSDPDHEAEIFVKNVAGLLVKKY